MIDGRNGLEPFSRDQLFLSVYDSCKHRSAAVDDATALVHIIVAQVLAGQQNGIIRRQHVVETAHTALKRFDQAAATMYLAYHPFTV